MKEVLTDKGVRNQLKPPFFQILGIKVNALTLEKAISLVEKGVKSNKQYQITTPNPEQIVLAQQNPGFKEVLNHSDLAIPDGVGLVWAMKRQWQSSAARQLLPVFQSRANEALSASKTPSRIRRLSGVDLMEALCALAAKKNWRVFLLGGREAAEQAAAKLQVASCKLQVRFDSGAKDIKKETPADRKRIINSINDFRPHLLFVAYGAPYQELWIAKNLPLLRVRVAMSVGGAFDYLSGQVKRAPLILQKMGLEWLYRLVCQPWRLKRQLALVKFMWLVMVRKESVK
ncbi:hypothetical protein A2160_05155 [Candidatus Beckwithbacteria bacterium RBG_13_42_9]|uniref:Uncharacterized protein n=1 Tax=Candidatus Beckwithbacteria bacterium RBG_13_42_9 TaxID=1797457 RepID=A0A1F5E6H6_9BACT|nr:MAG: hypothetical protein A2160_05155 [Candidatus Beckwithbacteria bacterium RBG_13_42_9]